MLLRVYQEWVNKFHAHLNKDVDDGDHGFRKRFVVGRPSSVEQKWCRDRGLDLNVLREVANLACEIRQRFLQMNISKPCLNSRVNLRGNDPHGELVIKTCIGGAFYPKYVKAQYKNEDMLMRMKNSKDFNAEEAKHSVILNAFSESIQDGQLVQYMQSKFKVPVKELKIQNDKPTVVFGEAIWDRGLIKSCFKLGMRRRFQ